MHLVIINYAHYRLEKKARYASEKLACNIYYKQLLPMFIEYLYMCTFIKRYVQTAMVWDNFIVDGDNI